ncbi:hypothetical protein T190_31865 [Sinorhizobium meliloti CCBAU 01290]|nr:hypothetical protein T190_31865 [Sinorhizobium meliloti CCBAU 01290]
MEVIGNGASALDVIAADGGEGEIGNGAVHKDGSPSIGCPLQRGAGQYGS